MYGCVITDGGGGEGRRDHSSTLPLPLLTPLYPSPLSNVIHKRILVLHPPIPVEAADRLLGSLVPLGGGPAVELDPPMALASPAVLVPSPGRKVLPIALDAPALTAVGAHPASSSLSASGRQTEEAAVAGPIALLIIQALPELALVRPPPVGQGLRLGLPQVLVHGALDGRARIPVAGAVEVLPHPNWRRARKGGREGATACEKDGHKQRRKR